jgi:hypothetical protein
MQQNTPVPNEAYVVLRGHELINLNATNFFRLSVIAWGQIWQLISKLLTPSLRGTVLLDLYLGGKRRPGSR